MRKRSHFTLVGLVLCGCGVGQKVGGGTVLPLRTLRLYETGVGYFERQGPLSPGSTSTLPVPASHLDDALKTLIVLSPNAKSNVQGVEFGSSVSRGMSRAMAGLPTEGDAVITYRDLLLSLRGANVEVRMRGAVVVGRLIDVMGSGDGDLTPPGADDTGLDAKGLKSPSKSSALTLVFMTEASQIVRYRANDIESLRPTDPSYATRLGAALDQLNVRGAENPKTLRVLSDAKGPVTLGYITETPVWRTTYRFVFDAGLETGTLQGWALVHNDTDEDWASIHVELVNGRPDSFLFPLAAPRYGRRDLVTPENELSTVPQLLGKTADGIWGDHDNATHEAGEIALRGEGEGGGGSGEGIGLGSIGTVGHGSGGGVGSSSVLSVGNLAGVAEASGTESGALFTYALPARVDLRAHASALLPFLQQKIDAEAIAWFESPGAPARSAVRLVNSTSQTLPVGTIAFFGGGGFSGEAALDRMKPGERRFIQFGADPDVVLSVVHSHEAEEPKRLVFDAETDTLEEHFLRTMDETFAIENRSGRARIVDLALSRDKNAKLTGVDKTDFDAKSSRPIAIFDVAPHARVERATSSVEGLSRRTEVSALTSARLSQLAASTGLPAADRAVALDAAVRERALEDNKSVIEKTKATIVEVDKDLGRLRENLKALGDHNGGGANPFVQRILASEDKLTRERDKLAALEAETTTREAAVRASLAKLPR